MLKPDALTRLSNLCAQLSSTYEAICFVAAQKTTKLLAEHGLTWREMVDRAFVPKTEPTFKPDVDLDLISAPFGGTGCPAGSASS